MSAGYGDELEPEQPAAYGTGGGAGEWRLKCEAESCQHYGELINRGHVHSGGQSSSTATVVNGGDEVNLREWITSAPQQQLADRLTAVLGRKYLAYQLASLLPPDVAVRLADRVEELTGPEVERRVAEQIDRIHADVNEATAQTLARLAAEADLKRKELTRERFHPAGSRLS